MAWSATHTFSVGEVLTANNMNLIQNNINASNPVGALKFVIASSAGDAVESIWQGGWLECNRAQISRATYASLYNYHLALSPSLPFGNGNGSTTFTLADFQGGRLPAHHTPGGHADIGTLGNNDGVSLASRRIFHKHSATSNASSNATTSVNWSGSNNSGGNTYAVSSGNGISLQGGVAATNVSTNVSTTVGPQTGAEPSDTIPYLVAGIWVVKF